MNTSFWRSVYKNGIMLFQCYGIMSGFGLNFFFKASQFFLHRAACIISLKITVEISMGRLRDTQGHCSLSLSVKALRFGGWWTSKGGGMVFCKRCARVVGAVTCAPWVPRCTAWLSWRQISLGPSPNSSLKEWADVLVPISTTWCCGARGVVCPGRYLGSPGGMEGEAMEHPAQV